MKRLINLKEMSSFYEDNMMRIELENISLDTTYVKDIDEMVLSDQLGVVVNILNIYLKNDNYVLVEEEIPAFYKSFHVANKIHFFMDIVKKHDEFETIDAEQIDSNLAKELYDDTTLILWNIKRTDIKGAFYEFADFSVENPEINFRGVAVRSYEYEKISAIPIDVINDNNDDVIKIVDKDIDLTPYLNAKKIGLIK